MRCHEEILSFPTILLLIVVPAWSLNPKTHARRRDAFRKYLPAKLQERNSSYLEC